MGRRLSRNDSGLSVDLLGTGSLLNGRNLCHLPLSIIRYQLYFLSIGNPEPYTTSLSFWRRIGYFCFLNCQHRICFLFCRKSLISTLRVQHSEAHKPKYALVNSLFFASG